MQIIQPSSPGADGMAYANMPTCNSVMVTCWYEYVTSRLDTQTGPRSGYASQTACRIRGKALPNCSNYGTASLSVVLLTLGISTFVFPESLRIRRGRQCSWGTAILQERFSFSPNSRTASVARRRMLNPSLILL